MRSYPEHPVLTCSQPDTMCPPPCCRPEEIKESDIGTGAGLFEVAKVRGGVFVRPWV
jgi:hypothetical protein